MFVLIFLWMLLYIRPSWTVGCPERFPVSSYTKAIQIRSLVSLKYAICNIHCKKLTYTIGCQLFGSRRLARSSASRLCLSSSSFFFLALSFLNRSASSLFLTASKSACVLASFSFFFRSSSSRYFRRNSAVTV